MKDRFTGEEIDTGNKIPRLAHMAKRVYAFSEALEKLGKLIQFDLKMITLTYAPGRDWHTNDVRDFLRGVRRHIGDALLAYAWVAELQQRGAVHYHMYCAIEPGIVVPTPDESGLWPHGMSRIEKGRSVFYISAYTGKKYQKTGIFPYGLRMYSVWIRKGLLSAEDHWLFRLSAYPKWMTDVIIERKKVYMGNLPKRRKEGGWRIKYRWKDGSEHYDLFFSPYEIVRFTSPGSEFAS